MNIYFEIWKLSDERVQVEKWNHLKFGILNLKSEILNFKIWNIKSEILNSKSEISNLKFET